MKKLNKKENEVKDIIQTLKDFIELVDRRFTLLENKVGAVRIGVERAKEELRQQIEGLGMRIDDLSLHRAKYSDIEILQKQISDIRKRLETTGHLKK
ncbi:MAG: hypothetical protein A2W52_00700 [Candidatus Taylorbacteria bacterium RIFCSPHIGHO2_02_49_25]|uniref:Uncharacterized protein n=1 Tax=Candidatus Taylorbacteria bacterium RIFCSPHIGHO2_02_49_25 TaxID=1802305 RepID=A0A1G2MBC5_9BACT|nr:MAG: hypothetical protein UY62_C0028G0012 [Parcubacteria group bacterium GW2011_GWF2_50_9]OHA20126.1 MAG: hypothetical protein A2759_03075 [Candidatus Taylorbacteria bacterium RIFCSPHIGHO2_01_FULL_49_60]OHA21148.1 MAG: hypothetical protein A2W52_00700 [Candidatus Taylorbacteria bacterium RIFCSPHIGHO2_02_49_25]OHA36054.1 MAG: hypothetical protein A3B27_01660 [Candidatus Taylorbacteria bacterium RIFCSPLOWO2_01_FULL_50_130]OHA37592.1 MAG: hypothetical protein A2W65_02060 [Candidatus Taylorbacte